MYITVCPYEKKGFSGTGIDISSKCLNVCKNNINKLL